MTQLLISVKNPEEALIALQAGADLIDLKDPTVGALGALDNTVSQAIIHAVNQQVVISATIGEAHTSQQAILEAIDSKLAIGVDIVKLAIDQYFDNAMFLQQLATKIQQQNIKLVAVMFADKPIDFAWISRLASIGFYGVMLDTQNKHKHLLQVASAEQLQKFVNNCQDDGLQAGLAGSLRVKCVHRLLNYSADYLGFRSGVCQDVQRTGPLQAELIQIIKEKLYTHNKTTENVIED